MKYSQGIIGLLLGAALGGAGVAATIEPKAATADTQAIKQIVRDTIREEPQLILDSVSQWQEKQQKEKLAGAQESLKDPAIKAQIFDTSNTAFIGPADATRALAEFFDYNCPACKMQFSALDVLHKSHPDVKIIFKEYPIFGPQSETNSKIGLAVHRLYPDKYFNFHRKMMTNEGRTDEKTALGYVTALGMDAKKVKAETESDGVGAALDASRELGASLHLQGTPSLVIGDELVPHALGAPELAEKFK